MNNGQLSRLLSDYADLLEVQGANAFRLRAYRNAARTLKKHPVPIEDLVAAEADLSELPLIGKDLGQKLATIVQTGSFAELTELQKQLPPVVVDALRIPGLGPKKVSALVDELELTSLDDLKAAAESGRIAEVSGFGKKSAEAVLEGLKVLDQLGTRTLLKTAKEAADEIAEFVRAQPQTIRCEVAGSVRRRQETCGDLDLVVSSDSPAAIMDAIAGFPAVAETIARGDTKLRIRLADRQEMDVRVVPDASFGAALQYFTGSQAHNIRVRNVARSHSLTLNEYGLFDGDESSVAGQNEADIYAVLSLPCPPPELREDQGELDGEPPELLTLDAICGDLHMHTTASDGRDSIEAMAEAAAAKGYGYIAITDHSKRVSMANGLDERRLRAHWDDIRAADTPIDVWCGIECDILEDATLDLSDDVLAEADVVVAVLHYGLRQPREQIMKRLLMAASSPHVDIIGHPSGRILTKRPGADIHWPDLIACCRDHGTLLEINAAPPRLDLDDMTARAASDAGVPIVISTDAHATEQLDQMQWGVYQARRAGLTAADVANTRDAAGFRGMLKS